MRAPRRRMKIIENQSKIDLLLVAAETNKQTNKQQARRPIVGAGGSRPAPLSACKGPARQEDNLSCSTDESPSK